MKYKMIYETLHGPVIVLHDEKVVSRVVLPGENISSSIEQTIAQCSEKNMLILEKEIKAYFSGNPVEFSVLVSLPDFPLFTTKVLKETQKLRWGEMTTYGDLAKALGCKGGARAVGQALGRNPIPLLIPCHRVVARDNRLGGFSGKIEVKQWLLSLEGITTEGVI